MFPPGSCGPSAARQELVLLEQRLDVPQRRRRGEPADVPDGGRIRNGVYSRPSQSRARHVNIGKMK